MNGKIAAAETRTIETRLFHPEIYPILEQVLFYFSSVRHRLWRDLIIKSLPINELKRSYIKDFGLTARQFNSLAKEVGAKAKALEEIKQDRLKKLKSAINSIESSIEKAEKSIKSAENHLKTITSYRLKLKAWQGAASQGKRPSKKPLMPKSIQSKFSEHLKREISQNRFFIHQKKRRMAILCQRHSSLSTQQKLSLCFGGKRYFGHQNHLAAVGLSSHEEWLEGFREKRSSQVFFLGSSDETAGNQGLQYDPCKKLLQLRLPNAPSFTAFGSHICFDNIEFPEHLRAEFYSIIGRPEAGARKTQKTKGPISYRLVRRVNPNTKEKAYYIQASFSVPANENITQLSRGAVGIDLNADHVAVTETDRFGNYVDSFLLPFDLKGLSTDQSKAILGDISAIIVAHSLKTGKALVVEELDFEEKKKALREQAKTRRAFLSAFAYSQFQKAIRSKARSQASQLISINPAYTSLIGAYKFQGLKISSHEKAALAIARRAQGYSEGLKVFQGTLPTQVMMSERALFEQGSRHVWGFYSDYRQRIRSHLIEPDKRPLLPILRALSLARRHRSLEQSLSETWQERVGESLRCDSA